jgi:hypothetical protein
MSNHTATGPRETGEIRFSEFRRPSASVVYHGPSSFEPASGVCHGGRMTNVIREHAPLLSGLRISQTTTDCSRQTAHSGEGQNILLMFC